MVEAVDVLRDCEGREAGDIGTLAFDVALGLVDLTLPGRRLFAILFDAPIAESRFPEKTPLDLLILRSLPGVASSYSAGKTSSLSLKEPSSYSSPLE
jgi:hypothetical protein